MVERGGAADRINSARRMESTVAYMVAPSCHPERVNLDSGWSLIFVQAVVEVVVVSARWLLDATVDHWQLTSMTVFTFDR